MKIAQSVLLVLSMFGSAFVMSSSVQAQSYDCYSADTAELEATCALLANARDALNLVNPLIAKSPNTDLANAKRYSQSIINQSDNLAKLLDSEASDDEILDQMNSLRTTVLQLDATKRKLQQRYPANKELTDTLTYVRTLYFYLEGLLLPDAE